MRSRTPLISALFFLAIGILPSSVRADDHTKLVLVGGGNRPAAAMRVLADWAGGAEATILIVGWSSEQPEVYYDTISADLRAQGVRKFIASLRGPSRSDEVRSFVENFRSKLSAATAVFFTGGDQSKHMRVIALPGIHEALLAKYAAGTPFAGTSAGTSIMSRLMLTGEGSRVVPGLGLLPAGILVDQHARREGRAERDVAAMRANGIAKGILIDENNAFLVVDGERGKMFGPDYVKLFTQDGRGEIRVRELHEGDETPISSASARRHVR